MIMKKVKLTPEQKAYIKGLEKSKHRKAQKLQFRLQNAFFASHYIEVIDAELIVIIK